MPSDSHDETTPNSRLQVPVDYPGLAQSDRGEAVTSMETKPLDDGEHLIRLWTHDRDEPLELALTPTQVRQWAAEFDICEWRVNIVQQGKPALDDTVLTSTLGDSFHSPDAEACAAVNAFDTAIDTETTVREAVEDGYEPCRHCYDYDGWGPDELIQEVRIRGK